MASQSTVKMAAYLFAATVVALASIQVSMAKGPHPGARAAAKSAARTADPNHSSKGRDNAGAPRTQNANPIDTSITVLPRRPSGATSKTPYGKQGFRVVPRNTPQPYRSPAPLPGPATPRNAIGLRIVPLQPAGIAHGAPIGAHAGPPPPIPGGIGGGANARGTIGVMPRTAAGSGPLVSLPGGRVGGAPLIRPVAPPARIGGPTPAVGGINGTLFRQKIEHH